MNTLQNHFFTARKLLSVLLMIAGAFIPALAQSTGASVQNSPGDQPNSVTYRDVAPIFQQRCVRCHFRNMVYMPPRQLSLESYRQIMQGGDNLVVIPGYVRGSELFRRVSGLTHPRMPFDGPPWLPAQEIDLIGQWIADGAKDADGNSAPTPVGREIDLEGELTGYWEINGVPLVVDAYTRMKKYPRPGDYQHAEAVIGQDGRIYVRRMRNR